MLTASQLTVASLEAHGSDSLLFDVRVVQSWFRIGYWRRSRTKRDKPKTMFAIGEDIRQSNTRQNNQQHEKGPIQFFTSLCLNGCVAFVTLINTRVSIAQTVHVDLTQIPTQCCKILNAWYDIAGVPKLWSPYRLSTCFEVISPEIIKVSRVLKPAESDWLKYVARLHFHRTAQSVTRVNCLA